MTSARTTSAVGGADSVASAGHAQDGSGLTRLGPGPSISFSGRDAFNGERTGMQGPAVAPPPAAAGSTTPVCDQFVAAEGAAWPWCDTCGWRLDFHEPDHPIARRWAERGRVL